MPTRIFENLAMDRPVVVPNTKGIRDYFDQSQAIFFEPDNVDSLARAIEWAYLHPGETQEILANGNASWLPTPGQKSACTSSTPFKAFLRALETRKIRLAPTS